MTLSVDHTSSAAEDPSSRPVIARSVEIPEMCTDPRDVTVKRGPVSERFDEVDHGLPGGRVGAPGTGGRNRDDFLRGQAPGTAARTTAGRRGVA
jgi:hypothetical protein